MAAPIVAAEPRSSDAWSSESDPIQALTKTNGSAELAAWIDHYANPANIASQSSSSSSISSSYQANEVGASTATATSKLDDSLAALRQLSLSLSTVRDASRTELDQLISSLVSTIPKMGIELKLMSETASSLQSRVHTLQNHSSAKDPSTDAALAKIAALSKAKASLIEARHTLREAQAWSTLESQVNLLLSEQRWQEAVDRIAKAADSLRLFSGSDKSNEERSALLQSLTEKTQGQLITVLHEVIASRDAEKLARTAALLAQTQNGTSTFFSVYTQIRSRALLSRWAQTASETSDKPLPAQLTSLFGDLLALLGEERVASPSIFTDPTKATQLLTADILARLDPPIHVCIQQATRAPHLDSFLTALTDAYKATEEAIRAVQAIIPEAKPTKDPLDDRAEISPAPIDSNLLALETTSKTYLRLMVEPFIPYQTRLATFEAEAMQSRLQALQASGPADPLSISTASTQALQVVKAALRRSAALTKSFATPSLMPSFDNVFETAMARVREELESDLQHSLTVVQGRIRRMHLTGAAGQNALTYDERGEVLTASDWDEFRKATERLAACKESVAAVRALEETLAYQISELGLLARPVATNADQQAQADFTSAVTALATSSLNTSALHELIAKSKRILTTSSWNSPSTSADLQLLPAARASMFAIGASLQSFQHDLVLSQFLPELELYPNLSIWTSKKHPSIVNEYDLAMPKFSLSPTEAMARIGEAMLNLPRLFEAYADEVLLFCLNSSTVEAAAKGKKEEPMSRMHERHMSVAPSVTERSTMHRQAFSTTTVPMPTPESTTAEGLDEADVGVLSQYLRSLLTLFFSRFLSSTLPSLPRMTEIGAAQLAADLDYLSNISSVIYGESEAILRYWRKAAEIGTDVGRRLVSEHVAGIKDGKGSAVEGWDEDEVEQWTRSEAFRTMARLRGWM